MVLKLMQLIEDLLPQIINNDFNAAMCDESLSVECYTYYCVQDQLYLEQYARALAMIAARCECPQHVRTFLTFAYEAVDHEQALHVKHLSFYPIERDRQLAVGMNSTCKSYTDFLLEQTAYRPLPVAISAILPCFTIYQQVGRALKQHVNFHQKHRYRDWIEIYASDGFALATEQALSVLSDCFDMAHWHDIKQCFLQASHFEQAFWQSCYKRCSGSVIA